MCVFDGVRRGNYCGEEPIRGTEVQVVRVGKLKNGKATCKDDVTGEMIKGGGDGVVDWIWKMCNMAFKSDVVLEGWMSTMIVPLYKCKGERTGCSNFIG